MQLTPVESSNVAAVGYSAEERLLRIQFITGDVYDYPDTDPKIFSALLLAPSKGKFVREHLSLLGLIGVRHQSSSLTMATPKVPMPRTDLNSFEEDDCCNGPLIHALRGGELDIVSRWTCPKCGCLWEVAREISGVRHWIPRPYVEVMRRHEIVY